MSDSLDRARQDRAGLRSAMGEVEAMLAAPSPRREPAWRQELSTSLAALREALEWHIKATEGEDGLLQQIASSTPRLADRVKQASADHERLQAGIARAAADIEAGADVAVLRNDVVGVLTDLVRHRQLGSDLVYDAYNVDLEADDRGRA